MNAFVIHIGAPRTGTTVIQKSLLPRAKCHLLFQKQAYGPSGESINIETPYLAESNPEKLAAQLNVINPVDDPTAFFNRFIVNPASGASHNPSVDDQRQRYYPILVEAMRKLGKCGEKSSKTIVMSSEKLCETSASLACYSSHSKYGWNFSYIPICDAIRKVCQEQALISVCLESPSATSAPNIYVHFCRGALCVRRETCRL